MTAAIVRFRWRFTTLLASVFVCAGIAYGQKPYSAARGSFGVPLQPFSLHETADAGPRAEPIRVAYYAPRSQPALPPLVRRVDDHALFEAPGLELPGDRLPEHHRLHQAPPAH